MRIGAFRITLFTITFNIVVVFNSVNCDTFLENEAELESGACTGDKCKSDDEIKEEKMKYYLDKAKEYHDANSDGEMSEEDLKRILIGFKDQTIDIENIGTDQIEETEAEGENEEEAVEEREKESFEFPKLTMIDPGKVGDVKEVELEDGHMYRMITRSMRPPVFG